MVQSVASKLYYIVYRPRYYRPNIELNVNTSLFILHIYIVYYIVDLNYSLDLMSFFLENIINIVSTYIDTNNKYRSSIFSETFGLHVFILYNLLFFTQIIYLHF